MVYNYEKGRCLPSLEILIRAANAWGVTFELGGCKILPGKNEGRTRKRPVAIQQAFPFLEGVREADVEIVSVGPAGKGVLQVRLKIHFPNLSVNPSIVGA
jgi:transcriptional regulator with XRE-family HTH domain